MSILYEWITKEYLRWTILDNVIFLIELVLVITIGNFIYKFISNIKYKK